ncbi:MAG TPA: nucleotidyltransferase domain-containing protein [Myxococcales bacterium]|jgi:predicted nucleotidyltransferase
MPALIASALKQLRSALEARFGARLLRMRLFGSYARGEANEDSDVDVFVLLDEVSRQDFRAVLDAAADVSVECLLQISPLVFSAARYAQWKRDERAIVRDIEREGISV